MNRQLGSFALVAAMAFVAQPAIAQITDDFESDTSSDYTVLDDATAIGGDGTPDSSIAFAFDYVAAGIPLAPNSAPGDTSGLRMTTNNSEDGADGPTATEEDHIMAVFNAPVTGRYRLDVDVYLAVEGPSPGVYFSGTTEYAHVGVAGDGATLNSLFNPITGSGHFVAFNGDGDSSSDYRHSTPSTLAVPSGDSSYLNSDQSTNASVDFYQDLFPATDFPGSPGNSWVTLTVTVADFVTYWLDDVPFISTPAEATDGYVSLGYGDLFDSVGPHFVLYDNLSVTEIPEPSAAALAIAGLGLLSRRSRNR